MTITVTVGRKYREGHGIGRQWYFWNCDHCDRTEWYLNMEAMRAAAKEHVADHGAVSDASV
jgi:phage terminase large subunit GpA-like protein